MDIKSTARHRATVLVLGGVLASGSAFAQQMNSRGSTPGPQQVVCVDCDGGGEGGGGGTSAPSKVIYHKINPIEHTAETHLDNGTVMVIDYPLNKMFISGGGHTAELSLDAVLLEKANGNAQLASQLKNQIRSKLYQEGLMVELQAESGNQSLIHSRQGRRGPIQGFVHVPPGEAGGSNAYYEFYDRFYVPGWGGYGSTHWGLEPHPDTISDANYWDIWRVEHCNAMNSDFIGAGAGVATMAIGCGFFATGVGALACASGGIGVYLAMNAAASNAAVCLSHYPGPGNWGH